MNKRLENGSVLQQNAHTEISTIVRRGRLFAFGVMAAFFIAGTFIPISSAVVANGVVTTSGLNKLLQHPTGGTIKSIDVTDGTVVDKGDLIMVLNPAVSQADLSELKARQAVLLATKKRLEAISADGSLTAGFDGWTLRSPEPQSNSPLSPDMTVVSSIGPDPDVPGDILAAQQDQLKYGSRSDAAEYRALELQVERLRRQKAGLHDRLQAKQSSLQGIQDEIRRMSPLVRDGYMARKSLWDLQRQENAAQSDYVSLKSEADTIDQQIDEAQMRADAFVAGRHRDTSQQLTSVLGELGQIRDRITSSEIALNSTEMRAPVAGTLVNFSANTIGGVIRGGDVIGEIVPQDAELIVQVRLDPKDVAYVKEGQTAKAVVTALDRREYDPIPSKIVYVSADSVAGSSGGAAAGASSYVVRAKMLGIPKDPAGRPVLKPGMPVDLYIDAGARPFLAYLLKPFFTSFERAFREP